MFMLWPHAYTSLHVILDHKNHPFLTDAMISLTKAVCECVTSVFLCNPDQARVSVTQPPAVTEALATTTWMPSAVPVHLVGEETHATQVRPQDGIYH